MLTPELLTLCHDYKWPGYTFAYDVKDCVLLTDLLRPYAPTYAFKRQIPFHNENFSFSLPLWQVEHEEPKTIWQEQDAEGQSWRREASVSHWWTFLLAHRLLVLQAELLLFLVLWVTVKLHGLCKAQNSSMNKAWLSMFKKKKKRKFEHWVPEESSVYKHLDGFAHFFTPFTVLKITAGLLWHPT